MIQTHFSTKDQNIWFTSDTHFWHKNIIDYCSRPFSSIEEMNETLINNWKSRVGEGDIVFHLGDFAFCGSKLMDNLLHTLPGKIYWILGNHDMKNLRPSYKWRFEHITQQMLINIDGRKICLNHFPFLCYSGAYREDESKIVYQLFGHVHSGPRNKSTEDSRRLKMLLPYQYDVGVDNNEFAPISWEEVQQKIKEGLSK